MVDDALNIRGLKRYAVDNAGDVPSASVRSFHWQEDCRHRRWPRRASSAAYYLVLMGHHVAIYEKRRKLGGMMRYGIPSYRFPEKSWTPRSSLSCRWASRSTPA